MLGKKQYMHFSLKWNYQTFMQRVHVFLFNAQNTVEKICSILLNNKLGIKYHFMVLDTQLFTVNERRNKCQDK